VRRWICTPRVSGGVGRADNISVFTYEQGRSWLDVMLIMQVVAHCIALSLARISYRKVSSKVAVRCMFSWEQVKRGHGRVPASDSVVAQVMLGLDHVAPCGLHCVPNVADKTAGGKESKYVVTVRERSKSV
jgi:hypothetical protein